MKKSTTSYYFIDNIPPQNRKERETTNYAYHINNFSFPLKHKHIDYWEFTIIVAGEIINYSHNRKGYYTKNQMLISPAGSTHYLITNQNPTQYINIEIRKSYLEPLLKSIFPDNFNSIKTLQNVPISDHAIQKITKILYSTNLPQNNTPEKFDSLIKTAFLIVVQKISEHLLLLDTDEALPIWFKKMQTYINSAEAPSLTVADLCNHLDYSRTHLARLFKDYLHISPYEYLLKLKMEYAQNLLINTQLSILTISELLEYAHSGQFCKIFKQYFHVTPTEFRQEYKAKTANVAAYWNNIENIPKE